MQVKIIFAIAALLPLVLMAGCQNGVQAPSPQHGAVSVTGVWARTSAMTATNGAAYMVLHNMGPDADRLVGLEADVSERVEIHRSSMSGGMMNMDHVPELVLPPKEQVKLEPGGLHVMFIGLNHPLQEHTQFPLTLQFAHAGKVRVNVMVKAPGEDMGGHGEIKMEGGGGVRMGGY